MTSWKKKENEYNVQKKKQNEYHVQKKEKLKEHVRCVKTLVL